VPETTPIEIWFQDEARIGQKNGQVRQWARRGTRPRQPADQRYDNAYLFGAICPARGVGAALALPCADTEAMQCESASNVDPLHGSLRSLSLKGILLIREGQNWTPIELASNSELPRYFRTLYSKLAGSKLDAETHFASSPSRPARRRPCGRAREAGDGLRFSRRVSIIPDLRVNLGKSGASLSIGGRGAWCTVGRRGRRVRLGLPGPRYIGSTACAAAHRPSPGLPWPSRSSS
jgi:Protein of unknown function (DUF4236)